jgi:tetratricopeptide (TPR) repeat protein
MKHCYTMSNFKMLRSASLILALIGILYGCASKQPGKVEVQQLKPVIAPVELSAESRADFDAAMDFIKAEEYEKAIELLSKVAKASPNHAIPSINLALAYKKTGKLKLAEESLNLALKAEPENPVANNELALLYRKTGRFNEARQLYEKTLEKYPNFMMAHKNLGILCDLYMRDYECALKHYVIYSNAVQDDKTVKIWIADVQKRLGR